MFFGRYGSQSPHSPAITGHTGAPLPACPRDDGSAALSSEQNDDGWQEIYRQAYKQLVQGCGPSAFRCAIRPSVN